MTQLLASLEQLTVSLGALVQSLQGAEAVQPAPGDAPPADPGTPDTSGGGPATKGGGTTGGCGCGGEQAADGATQVGTTTQQSGTTQQSQPSAATQAAAAAAAQVGTAPEPAPAQEPEPAPAQSAAPPRDGASRAQVDEFINRAARAYGADAKVLSNIARLESDYRADAVNDWDSNAQRGTPSKGMFQFIEPTFAGFAPDARAANPKAWEGLGELDWMDWRQQALTTAWAITTGKGSHWATYARAGGR